MRTMHDFQEQCQVHGQRSMNMACQFASSTQQEIEKLLEDKYSENTKRSTKVAKKLFYEYLKEKNIQEPHNKKELVQVLKSFYVEARKKDGEIKTMYNKTNILLLDSVFVISGIIKVSVTSVITLTSTLIILDITKTSSNNCL